MKITNKPSLPPTCGGKLSKDFLLVNHVTHLTAPIIWQHIERVSPYQAKKFPLTCEASSFTFEQLLCFLTSRTGWWWSAKDSDMPGGTHLPQLHRPSMTSWASSLPALWGCTFSHISASYVSQLRNTSINLPKKIKGKIYESVEYAQNVPWHSLISYTFLGWGIIP